MFVESYAPRPDMYIFGASDHVTALVTMAKFLGYRVTVCDPRTTFMTRERFPDADELAIEWPDRFLENAPVDARTAICMMTHDLKFDVPALKRALATNAGYIGAIGSEKTRTEREPGSVTRASATPISPASMLRSASRSAPGRPRRWRSRSPPS